MIQRTRILEARICFAIFYTLFSLALLSCVSIGNLFPGVSAYGAISAADGRQLFIEQILVERTLESTTVGRQFTKLVPFFLSSRGWQVNETNDGVNRRVRFLLHEHEAYKNFTATNVIYIEMLIYEANEISPIFIARVWTEGQESLLDEALLQRLAQQLINQLPAVKVVAE